MKTLNNVQQTAYDMAKADVSAHWAELMATQGVKTSPEDIQKLLDDKTPAFDQMRKVFYATVLNVLDEVYKTRTS